MKLYHISENKELKEIIPQIPRNYFTNNGIEDNIRPRICCSRSIDECLSGLGYNIEGKEFRVYSIEVREEEIYKPSKPELPDSEISGELWIFRTKECKIEKDIRVKGIKKINKYNYWIKGEQKDAELVEWLWEVI